MFTGIIETTGTVQAVDRDGEAARLVIEARMNGEIAVGDSVAINGVCLTVTQVRESQFAVLAVEETLRRTTLGKLKSGKKVNLELPLRPTDRLGGHFVQGHVDGKAKVKEIRPEGEGSVVTFEVPAALRRYIVEKGSIAVDGVSLTVTGVDEGSFSVALIPRTRDVTTLGDLKVGDDVNIEVDILAKYIERLSMRPKLQRDTITEAKLRKLGY